MADLRPPADTADSARTGTPAPYRSRTRRVAAGVAAALAATLIAGCGQLSAAQDPFRSAAPATSPAAEPSVTQTATPSATASASPSGTASPSASASASGTASASSSPSAEPSDTAEAAEKPERTDRREESAKQDRADDEPADPKSPEPKKSPSPTAGPTILGPDDTGKQVRELQARLKQIDWFSGDVTNYYGDQTAAAVEGFQGKRGLPVTGAVDQKTWNRLAAMTEQPSHNQMFNVVPSGPAILEPGDTGKQVRELQARLKQLEWFFGDVTDNYGPITTEAVEGFQDKRGLPTTGEVDQKTWNRLVAMTDEPTKAELTNATGSSSGGNAGNSSLDPRCMTGRAMCIDKTTNQLVWVIDGQQQLSFDVRFGAQDTPTREGTFSVGWKAEDWTSTLYDSEMPFSMFFSGGQAVHYSSDFASYGYSGASHGCVNVRDYDGIKNLFSQVDVGDKVIVYRS